MICRECGCADDNACLVAGVPCLWVEADLCSACASVSQLLEARGGLAWLLLVAAHLTAEQEGQLELAALDDVVGPGGAAELIIDTGADWGA